MKYGQRASNSSKFIEVSGNPFTAAPDAFHVVIFPGMWTVHEKMPTYEDMWQMPYNKAFLHEMVEIVGAIELKDSWDKILRNGWYSADQYAKSIEELLIGSPAKNAEQLKFHSESWVRSKKVSEGMVKTGHVHKVCMTTVIYQDPETSIKAKNSYKALPDKFYSEEALQFAENLGELIFSGLGKKNRGQQRKAIAERLSRITFYGHSFGSVFYGMAMNALRDVAKKHHVDPDSLIDSGVLKNSALGILTGFSSNVPLGDLQLSPDGGSLVRGEAEGKWPTTLQVIGVDDMASRVFSAGSVAKPDAQHRQISVKENPFGVVVFADTPESIAIKKQRGGIEVAELYVDKPRHAQKLLLTRGPHNTGFVDAVSNALRMGIRRAVVGITPNEVVKQSVAVQVPSFNVGAVQENGGIKSIVGLPGIGTLR